MPLSLEDLRQAALARQFPVDPPGDVAALLALTGPIQSQTARSTFLGLAARAPGLTREAITEAFEAHRIVRGSTLRGTVHTSVPEQQAVLDTITRITLRKLWARTLPMQTARLEDIWADLETYARDEWRTPDELAERLRALLLEHGEDAAVAALDRAEGRSLAFGHGGLIRRPLTGGWEQQGRPGYRTTEALTGRAPVPADRAIEEVVLLHLRCHGPASRQDIAWWSGLGLRQVDHALSALADSLVRHEGPLDRTYHDVPDAPAPRDLPGVRLLPEFDALLCGYDSKVRDRFVTREQHDQLWSSANGLLRAPLLVDGRITGYWRMTGSAKKRPVEVRWFAGTRRPRKAELTDAIAAVQHVLDITVQSVTITRA